LLGFGLLSSSSDQSGESSGPVAMIKGWFSSDSASTDGEDGTVYLTEPATDALPGANTENGNPAPGLSIAPPGGLQENRPVPGEENVEVTEGEVFQFSDLLARRNGFAPLREQNPDLRNPDLVFPGDRLNLPDGRILQITPGEYIWEVARKQYRRDMARLAILDRQIRELGAEYQKKKSLMS
ncbi:MAG: hypothetical protein KDK25_01985, partial [Leptospiraceae bacterium]|nr:hypothetical protein [Leptospiraceae bacterium]